MSLPIDRVAVVTWHTGPLAALDLEATGVDPATARIIEVALLLVDEVGNIEPVVDALVDPGVPIPPQVTDITGITSADLASRGADLATVLARVVEAIEGFASRGVPIVIYHAPYDWPLLGAELTRHGLPALPNVPPTVLVDPLVLDRHVDRYRKGKRTLDLAAGHYGVRHGSLHRAAADAATAVAVTRALVAKHPELGDLDGPGLVALQVKAHRKWRDSFNEWLVSQGSTDNLVEGDWPGA